MSAAGSWQRRAAVAGGCQLQSSSSGLQWCDIVVGDGALPIKGAFTKYVAAYRLSCNGPCAIQITLAHLGLWSNCVSAAGRCLADPHHVTSTAASAPRHCHTLCFKCHWLPYNCYMLLSSHTTHLFFPGHITQQHYKPVAHRLTAVIEGSSRSYSRYWVTCCHRVLSGIWPLAECIHAQCV